MTKATDLFRQRLHDGSYPSLSNKLKKKMKLGKRAAQRPGEQLSFVDYDY